MAGREHVGECVCDEIIEVGVNRLFWTSTEPQYRDLLSDLLEQQKATTAHNAGLIRLSGLFFGPPNWEMRGYGVPRASCITKE